MGSEQVQPVDETPTEAPPARGRQRRKSGRLGQELLGCQYGPVINLSGGGMCVLCRKVPPAMTSIVLTGLDAPLTIKARVAWAKRVGLFKHEVGFQFEDITPELRQKLTGIATSGRVRRML